MEEVVEAALAPLRAAANAPRRPAGRHCGQRMTRRGSIRGRCVTVRGGQQVSLRCPYLVCPACAAGFGGPTGACPGGAASHKLVVNGRPTAAHPWRHGYDPLRLATARTNRDPRDTWFWWLGGQPLPPLADLARLYPRRFGIEHGYKFDKGDLLWTAPHLRTPEQMERWTAVVSAVHNEIGLARDVAQAQRLPWEAATRPLTPRQVRRGLGRIIRQVGTPTAAPRLRGKAPGRPRGAVISPAPRHPVIRKSPARLSKRRRAA